MSAPEYRPSPLHAPRLAGWSLRLFAWLLERPLLGALARAAMRRQLGIHLLRGQPAPTEVPRIHRIPAQPRDAGSAVDPPATPPAGWPTETIADFGAAYASGRCTPADIAERVIAAIDDDARAELPLRAIIACRPADVRAAAAAAAERHAAGRPLGPLDGVPVAIKDELDVAGYPTTVGTKDGDRTPAAADATVVARLRAAGAVLIGKANMHEIGIGVTGINPHHGVARNPHDPGRCTGGSSSGSGAAVAAGLCPLAIGADGGGSIRIPAALCGVLGLKATYGRISEHGAAPLCWSVAHVGPLAACAADLALGYRLIAGVDPADPNTAAQPDPGLGGSAEVSGLRVGVVPGWFEDADPAVVAACQTQLDALVGAGATRVEVALDLTRARPTHLVLIATEMAAAMVGRPRSDFGPEVRANLALARSLPAVDYVHAQRLRGRIVADVAAAFETVDVLALPATACTAPPVQRGVGRCGESDLTTLERIMRFSMLANLTGQPGISLPAGYDPDGLPIGLQLLGRPWDEQRLIGLAAWFEPRVPRRPAARAIRLLEPGA